MKDSRSRWREPSEPRRAGTETLVRRCKSTQPGARRLTSPALGSETCGSYPSLALGKTGKVRAAFAKAPARPPRQEALGGAREGRNCEPRAPRLHPRFTEVHTPDTWEKVKKKTGRKERKKTPSEAGTCSAWVRPEWRAGLAATVVPGLAAGALPAAFRPRAGKLRPRSHLP